MKTMYESVPISNLMTRDVISVNPNQTLSAVKEIFDTHDFHHIPVVDENGILEGIISRSDFNMICDKSTIFKSGKAEMINERFFKRLIAKEVMTKTVLALKESDSITKAVDVIRENLFHGIPVVDDKKRVIGMITTYDLLNYAYSSPPEIE